MYSKATYQKYAHTHGVAARIWLLAGLVLMLAGCVTINIYFPAAAAEKAADRIIDEVWQLRQQDKNAPAELQQQPEQKPEQKEGNGNATPDAKSR